MFVTALMFETKCVGDRFKSVTIIKSPTSLSPLNMLAICLRPLWWLIPKPSPISPTCHQYRLHWYLLQLWILFKVKRCFYFVSSQLYWRRQFQFFLFSVVSDRIIKFRLRIWFRVSWFFVQRILQRLKQIKLKKNNDMYLGFMPITKITNVVVKMNLASHVIQW